MGSSVYFGALFFEFSLLIHTFLLIKKTVYVGFQKFDANIIIFKSKSAKKGLGFIFWGLKT